MDPKLELPLDALLRSISVNRDASNALFLGAGASISSGVKSATRCIWEWKQQIFLTNQPPDVVRHFRELSLPSVRRRIQEWLDDKEIYPALGAPEEYGVFAEKCHPLPGDRAAYFRGLCRDARPGIGYQLLATLAKSGLVSSVWTTNFDGLAARAATGAGLEVIEVGEDSVDRLERSRQKRSLLHVSLHGDYRYDYLRNTSAELQQQNDRLQRALAVELTHTTALIVGYSGRDRSIMQALENAYAQKGTGRLFWCGYQDEQPTEAVERLLCCARDHGREAYYVRSGGFDDLVFRLATHALAGDEAAEAQRIVSAASTALNERSAPFKIDGAHTSGIVKSNAFPVRLPGEVLQFTAREEFTARGSWAALRERTRKARVVAVPQGGKVLAIGLVDDVRELFKDADAGPIERTPITERDLGRAGGAVTSLLTSALVRAIAHARELESDGESLLWIAGQGEKRSIVGATCFIQQAAVLRLQRQAGSEYLLIKPSIRVTDSTGALVNDEIAKEAKRQILGKQWNQAFNDALNGWLNRISPSGASSRFEYPAGVASTFSFTLERLPVFARIQSTSPSQLKLEPKIDRVAKQLGTEFREPPLLFSARQGSMQVSDPHPIRGLVQNRPYDHSLTVRGLRGDVRLGIVAPYSDGPRLNGFLSLLQRQIEPDSKQEYLLAYPGFQQAFGVGLDIPARGAAAWGSVSEPTPGMGVREGALFLRERIQQTIDALVASSKPTVVLIFVPRRWRQWEHYELDGEYFDLHDFIKAYCVQKGVATQLLREETTTKRYECEVAWWLALSLYVKAMRTPWILQGINSETAFVGLGFSIDKSAHRGRHVLLGCSHMYNPSGVGLTFRLSKIEDGFSRRGNPFMSKADARRMAESVCEMFWDTHQRLPERVVFHRRTPFLTDEREGLVEGLFGVRNIDMLEINVDPMLRYVAASIDSRGSARGDAYPIRRGSAIVLERDKALLWVHGTTDPVKSGRPYFQGKSRIPAPLVVKRHHGSSDLSNVAQEILGLSKMNWNTADMYTKLPATIESSNRIAAIGALIERTQPDSYDYRLFI